MTFLERIITLTRSTVTAIIVVITASVALVIAPHTALSAQNGTTTNPPSAQQGQLLEGRYVVTFSGATNGRGRQDLIDALELQHR